MTIVSLCYRGSFVLFERGVTPNQCKVFTTDHLYPLKKHFHSFLTSKMTPTFGQNSKVHRGYGVAFRVPFNIYGTFWGDLVDSALHYHHQNTNCRKIFWNYSVHCSRTTSETWVSEGALKLVWQLVEAKNLTKAIYVVLFFAWSCQASVISFALKICRLKRKGSVIWKTSFSSKKKMPTAW